MAMLVVAAMVEMARMLQIVITALVVVVAMVEMVVLAGQTIPQLAEEAGGSEKMEGTQWAMAEEAVEAFSGTEPVETANKTRVRWD